MRAVVIHGPGDYSKLTIEERADPEPGRDEVVVSTTAIGVNYADCIVRMGLYSSAREYVGWPIVPGFEACATIEKLGADVRGWSVGDRVIAVTRFGGYATKLCVPSSQLFAPIEGFSDAECAGFPAVFLTAHYALETLANARAGETMLVHSAAGGVGTALAQLGRALGCTVVGVVGSSSKVATAYAAGAQHVIVRDEGSWERRARAIMPTGYSMVFDANGADTLRASYELLAAPGRLVVYGFASMLPRGGSGRPNWLKLAWDWLRTPRFNPLDLTTRNRSVLALNLSYLFEERALLERSMRALSTMANRGQLRPPPVTEFAFERVADAHRAIESGSTVGKLVLRVR
ncbi:MAG: medium chain dehydrogenase/reductase family protein [Polyangiales bacterium]